MEKLTKWAAIMQLESPDPLPTGWRHVYLAADVDRLTPRWTTAQAQAVLAVRDALVRDDYNEAYHQLVVLADTLSDDPYKHWKGLEALAGPIAEPVAAPEPTGETK